MLAHIAHTSPRNLKMASASPPTPTSLAAPLSPSDTAQPSTSISSLDDIEQQLLTLLHSASHLLTTLSAVTAQQAEQSKQHAHTFLTTLQQLRTSLTAATAAAAMSGGLAGERQQRRSTYLDQLMFELECDMSAHISEQLDGIEQLAQQSSDRARQRLAEAGLG